MDEGSEFYHSYGHVLANGGLLDIFYIGVKTSLYPCLIFLGVGAMTDFGPLLSNPKSMLMGASAQLVSLWPFSWRFSSDSPAPKPPPSVSLVVQTAPRLFS